MGNLPAALHYSGTGQPVASSFFNQHLLIVGQTGSGKTTTALSLLDQLQHENQTAIVLDPTGEYSQLPNAVTYRLGENAYLEAGKLDADEFQEVLGIAFPPPLNQQLEQAINSLKVQKNICHGQGTLVKLNRPISHYQELLGQLNSWASDYDVQQLPQQLIEEAIVPLANEGANYTLLGQQYNYPLIRQSWPLLTAFRERLVGPAFRRLFDTDAHPGSSKTELGFVVKMFLHHRSSHRTLVIDLSILKGYEHQQGAIISYLLKLILNDRLAQQGCLLPVKVVLDEAHRYLPSDGKQLAHNGIFQVLREGRKVNLQLALTTQSPLDLPARLRSQFSSVIIHRLLAPSELSSLPTDLSFKDVTTLATGQAYLLNDQLTADQVNVQTPQWWTK